MSRILLTGLLFICLFPDTRGQLHLLDRDDILAIVNSGLKNTYNFQFDEARKSLSSLKEQADGHPAVPFFEALIIYWENYPLTPDNTNASKFLSCVEEAYTIAEGMLQKDPDDLEGLFFYLFGKAFYVMFWADNGKTGKVIPYLNMMYRYTLLGFDLKEQFNEFYFTTGLYNYYIVAYPEKYPAYRPIALLFKKGDKKVGLEQLIYCAENSVFLRVEARFFLSFISLYYENDLRSASDHASKLYREFPNNSLYTGLYAQILMLDNKYALADVLISHLEKKKDPYAVMQGTVLRAIYLEKYERKYELAVNEFQKGLELSRNFGTLSKDFSAMALMGLGRYHQRENNMSSANRFFRMARSESAYDYILNDRL